MAAATAADARLGEKMRKRAKMKTDRAIGNLKTINKKINNGLANKFCAKHRIVKQSS